MDPYSSPYIIPNKSPHSLLRTRQNSTTLPGALRSDSRPCSLISKPFFLLLLLLLGFLDLPWSCSWRVRWLLGAPFAARVLVLVPVLGLVEAPSTERALVLGLWDLPSTKLHLPVAAPRIGAQVHMHRRSRLQKPGLNH